MTGIILKELDNTLVEFDWNGNKCTLPIPEFQTNLLELVNNGIRVEFDIKHTPDAAVALITKIHNEYDLEL